jgi:hypothetical protein
MSSRLNIRQFERVFRLKVRNAVRASREFYQPPNLAPTPAEKANATRLLLRGELQPGDMAKWVEEEVANVL